MAELERVSVKNAFIESTATFAEPAFGLPNSWERLHSAMLKALKPWGLEPRGISFRNNPANLSEVRVNYQLPDARFVLGVGVSAVVVNISNPAWEDLPRFLPAVEAGLTTIRETIGVTVSSQGLALGMHVQSQTNPDLQVLHPFVKAEQLLLPDEKAKGYALTVHTDFGSYSIEPSLHFPGGLYIAFNRLYPGDKTLAAIADDIRGTEERVLKTLGLTLN